MLCYIFAISAETAMLLPVSYGASRRTNETHDIRRNLRFRTVKDETASSTAMASDDPANNYSASNYCVRFEVTKVTKACHREKMFDALSDGDQCSSSIYLIDIIFNNFQIY